MGANSGGWDSSSIGSVVKGETEGACDCGAWRESKFKAKLV